MEKALTMNNVYTIKTEVDGKMVWKKNKGELVTFTAMKALRNYLRNRQWELKNPQVFLNGEKIDLSGE
jgi:hypothetical protein